VTVESRTTAMSQPCGVSVISQFEMTTTHQQIRNVGDSASQQGWKRLAGAEEQAFTE